MVTTAPEHLQRSLKTTTGLEVYLRKQHQDFYFFVSEGKGTVESYNRRVFTETARNLRSYGFRELEGKLFISNRILADAGKANAGVFAFAQSMYERRVSEFIETLTDTTGTRYNKNTNRLEAGSLHQAHQLTRILNEGLKSQGISLQHQFQQYGADIILPENFSFKLPIIVTHRDLNSDEGKGSLDFLVQTAPLILALLKQNKQDLKNVESPTLADRLGAAILRKGGDFAGIEETAHKPPIMPIALASCFKAVQRAIINVSCYPNKSDFR